MELRLIAFLLAALATLSPLFAEEQTGGIVQGTIADATGVIPGGTVTLLNLETDLTRTVLTDDSGAFSLPRVEAGTYELSAGMIGFRELVYTGLIVNADDVLNLDLVMEVAEVSVPNCAGGRVSSPSKEENAGGCTCPEKTPSSGFASCKVSTQSRIRQATCSKPAWTRM